MRSWIFLNFHFCLKPSASPLDLLASCPLDNLWKSLVSGDNTEAVNIKKTTRGTGCVQKHNKPVPANYQQDVWGRGWCACRYKYKFTHEQLELAVGVSSAILARLAEHSSIMRVTETLGGRARLVCFVLYLLQTSMKSRHARWHSLPLNLKKVVPLVLEHITHWIIPHVGCQVMLTSRWAMNPSNYWAQGSLWLRSFISFYCPIFKLQINFPWSLATEEATVHRAWIQLLITRHSLCQTNNQ